MTAASLDLIVYLRRLGVDLRTDGDRLQFRPASAVGSDLRLRLVKHKVDIVAALATASSEPSASSEQARLHLRQRLAGIVRTARRQGDRGRVVDALETFNHRAAVMQFDAGLIRHEAERLALLDALPHLLVVVNTEPGKVASGIVAGPGGGLFGGAVHDDAVAWAR